MKRFPKSILRACCAIAGGVVLVQYREQAVMWITVGIGIVFFISAVISFIDYLALRKNSEEQVELYDAQGRKLGQRRQRRFPVVAVGCGILGSVMALSPGTFVGGLMFVLAALKLWLWQDRAIHQLDNFKSGQTHWHVLLGKDRRYLPKS